MSQPEEPKGAADPSAPAQDAAAVEPASVAKRVAKGCGCAVGTILTAVLVAFAAGWDAGAWGASLAGVVILVMVMATSGTNGFWGLRG